jgi:hypothetical protein
LPVPRVAEEARAGAKLVIVDPAVKVQRRDVNRIAGRRTMMREQDVVLQVDGAFRTLPQSKEERWIVGQAVVGPEAPDSLESAFV